MTKTADPSNMTLAEIEAFGLTQAGIRLDNARSDKSSLAAALDHNLQIWVAIKTQVNRSTCLLAQPVRDNLTRLSNFVVETTMKHGVNIPDNVVDTLININLQISEGLLEGNTAR